MGNYFLKKSVVICVVLIGLIFILPINSNNALSNEDQIILTKCDVEKSVISENTNVIYITSNTIFHLQALNRSWPGNGSPANPYRIEDSEFAGNSTHDPVYIKDTTVYFVIDRCAISGYSVNNVIFQNVQNGVINDTVLSGLDQDDLEIVDSSFCNITSCTFLAGLQVATSEFLKLQDCVFTNRLKFHSFCDSEVVDCTIEGIFEVTYLHNCLISRCKLESGLITYLVDECEISGNTITKDFYIADFIDSRIIDNQILDGFIQISADSYFFNRYDIDFNNNTINGKEIGYYYNITGMDVDSTNFGCIIVAYCNNTHFHNGIFSSPIYFVKSNNCSLTDATIDLTSEIQTIVTLVEYCDNITLTRNTINAYDVSFLTRYSYKLSLEFNDIELKSALNTSSLSFYECELAMRNNSLEVSGDIAIDCGDLVCFAGNDVIAKAMAIDTDVYEFSDNNFQCTVTIDTTGYPGRELLRNSFIGAQDSGLIINYGNSMRIIDNKFMDNGHYGLQIYHCVNCTIYNNTFIGAQSSGLFIHIGNSVRIIDNTFMDNGFNGLQLSYCENCIIYNNRLGWNERNAVDAYGANNTWDDSVGTGNAWSDYDGSGVYEIEGDSSSVDRYPRLLLPTTTATMTESEFPYLMELVIIIGVAGIASFVVVIVIKRRK
ncbi:right-handed parallel beta-helix repeat-containing protein [Candidatus Thorarchaeota archaeon]|nr:MAG: right-handed parallel beta-helix repeat-containing protein [Candidatus Thorarchaeota archaeon]